MRRGRIRAAALWLAGLVIGCGRARYEPASSLDAGGTEVGVLGDVGPIDAAAPPADAGPCVLDAPCAPMGFPCSSGRTTCAAGVVACVPSAALPDGTDCGGAGLCTAGVCDRSPARRLGVSGAADRAEAGFSVATDGTRVVAGARYVSASGALRAGAAHVFERGAGGDWTVVAQLVASDAEATDEFGSAVAIDGDTILVGAHYWDGASVRDAGAVYVFERGTDGVWREVSRIALDQPRELGNAIALQGSRAVVGAEYDDGPGALQGAVHVLERQAGGWTAVARLTHPAGDRLGRAVALDGDRVVAGSLYEGAPDLLAGAAHIWERAADGTWIEVATLRPSRPSAYQAFGSSLALAGDRLVVGAQSYEEGGVRGTGIAYVFERDSGGVWREIEVLADPAPAGDAQLGRSVVMRGDTVIVSSLVYGAPADLRVHAFRRDASGGWMRVAELGDSSADYGGGSAIGGIEVDLQLAWRGEVLVLGMPLLADASGQRPGGLLVLDASGL